MKCKFAVREPVVEGVNCTETVQLALTARLVPQPFTSEKSAAFVPVSETAIPVRLAEPVFVKTALIAPELTLTTWFPKGTDVGLKEAVPELPVPLRETVCGDPEALSVTVSVPVRAPAAVGVNVFIMVQEFPGASGGAVELAVKLEKPYLRLSAD